MQLVIQFITGFLSTILDATKKAKAFATGIDSQTQRIQNLMNEQQQVQQNAEGQIVTQYEDSLKKQKLIYEIQAVVFVVLLIILAFVISSIINKK